MYGYYMLKALKLPCPIPDVFITTMQITQMIVGTFIQGAAMMFFSDVPGKCGVHYGNLVAGGVMYGSYFALFFKFALDRFVFKKPNGGKGGEAKKAVKADDDDNRKKKKKKKKKEKTAKAD